MSIYTSDEVLDCYDTIDRMIEEEEKLVEDLINYDDGIMHREIVDRLDAAVRHTVADLPATLEDLKLAGHL